MTGMTVVAVAVAVSAITFRGWKVEEKESGPAPDATALAWLCEALETRSPRSAIEGFPGVSRAKIKEESNVVHGFGRHDLTVRVGAWNLKASYDTGAFGNTYHYDYRIETAGDAGAKVFRSLDDVKQWLGRFGAIREVPPTYSVTLLNSKDLPLPPFLEGQVTKRDYAEASVNATYTKTSQSLEFQLSAHGFVGIFQLLCMK